MAIINQKFSLAVAFNPTMKFKLLVILGVVASTLSVALKSNAQVIQCKGSLGRITVSTIQVPANSFCILRGTTVLRDIDVKSNARLIAVDANTRGNVFAQDSHYLNLGNSTVRGFVRNPPFRPNRLPQILRDLRL